MTQKPIDNQRPERMPPQAIEIEQAVLGAMMLEQRAIVHTIEILDPSCFYNTTHSQIFEAIMDLFERGVAVDQLTLARNAAVDARVGVLNEIEVERYEPQPI